MCEAIGLKCGLDNQHYLDLILVISTVNILGLSYFENSWREVRNSANLVWLSGQLITRHYMQGNFHRNTAVTETVQGWLNWCGAGIPSEQSRMAKI